MAFNYYTIDAIKEIKADAIPEAFRTYYQGLSEELRAEIKDVRPDLAAKLDLGDEAEQPEEDNSFITDASEETEPEDDDEEENDSEEDEYDSILEAWEDISIRAWQNNTIETSVVVCKVIPPHTHRCMIHRIALEQKQLKIRRKNGGTYNIKGFLCPECMDFFIEQDGIDTLAQKLNEYNIPAWIQPAEDTLVEWRENTEPLELERENPIYIPDTWVEGQETCPVHTEESLVTDLYRRSYKDRSIDFEACFCKKCNKIIMRNALAQKLEEQCGEVGIPPIDFLPLKPEPKQKVSAAQIKIRPDYFIQNGNISEYDFDDEDVLWDQITEKDTVVVNYSRSCIEEDHEAEDTIALIQVQEKKAGRKHYLVLIGYCRECEKYYIAKEDFELLAQRGRPAMTLIDETGAYDTITSGKTFDHERDHLEDLENTFDKKIYDIQHSPGYVGKYAVGDYDDGALMQAKVASAPLYEEINKLGSYKPKPYGYRTDLTFGDKTEIYYLGVEDIELDGHRHVISFNSDLGRKMVNYRTLDMMMRGVQWKVKRRRNFDIEKGLLYGFTEQSDEDVIFRSGITDSFLIKVLNMRKKQHQLVDIISTIQENQNTIVDLPLRQNLIVQGCAGSGKTMVLLHRLSALKYKYKDFDFDHAVILTPNGNFNTHIAGLASSLQLGHIDRYSVEEYYYRLLQRYDSSFKLKNPISDEMNVNQRYVDFIYSDEFAALMEEAYVQKIQYIRGLFASLQELSLAAGRELIQESGRNDKDLSGVLRLEINEIKAQIENASANCRKEQEKLKTLQNRQAFLVKHIQEQETVLKDVEAAETAKASQLLKEHLRSIEESIAESEKQIAEKEEEYKQIQGTILVIRKTQKLNQLQASIDKIKGFMEDSMEMVKQVRSLIATDMSEKSYTDRLIVLEQAEKFTPVIRENINAIQVQKNTVLRFQKELEEELPPQIQSAQEAVKTALSNLHPKELAEKIETFASSIRGLSPRGIYADIYEIASTKADEILFSRTGKRYKQNIRGTHRYDLYLQLRFAMKYFMKTTGEDAFICIDEGQDLSPAEYRLIKDLNGNQTIFNIYGDTNQLLKTGRGITDWKLVDGTIEEPEKFFLNENYRNTNQITQFCNDTFGMQVSLTGVDGHSVKEITRLRLESMLANLKVSDERVAVILPRTVKKADYLDKEQLPMSLQAIMGDTVENGRIAVVYVDEVKGVEFDRIFVVPNSMTKNEQYIAFTRALSELTVVYDDSLDVFMPTVQDQAADPADVDQNQLKDSKKPSSNVKSTGTIIVGKVKGKRDKAAEEKLEALKGKIHITKGDISKTNEGTIITIYSSSSQYSGKLQHTISKAAGNGVAEELKNLGECKLTEAVITSAGNLFCENIIHVNSPSWNPDDEKKSLELLGQTYRNILQCARDHSIRVLSIPAIALGMKGYPTGKATDIAIRTIGQYLEDNPDAIEKITFVLFDNATKTFYDRLFRVYGKKPDTKISIGTCRKCEKRIRIRKPVYHKHALVGFMPRYCTACSKETAETRICSSCGVEFAITFGETDYSAQTKTKLSTICKNCRNLKVDSERVKSIQPIGLTEQPDAPSAVEDQKSAGKTLSEKHDVAENVKTELLIPTNNTTIINDGEPIPVVLKDGSPSSGTVDIETQREKPVIDFKRILEYLPGYLLDKSIVGVGEDTSRILAEHQLKTNRDLIQFLNNNSDSIPEHFMTEVIDYLKELVFSSFYLQQKDSFTYENANNEEKGVEAQAQSGVDKETNNNESPHILNTEGEREIVLDVADHISYSTIYEAINGTVGTEYTGWMRACWPNYYPVDSFRIWFPKLKEIKKGVEIPASFDCLNTISNDWNEFVFDDLKGRQTEQTEHYYGYDLIFAKEPDGGPYIFRGVFILDAEKTVPNHSVSKRIGTKVRLIGKPASKIEILDDFRKKPQNSVNGK